MDDTNLGSREVGTEGIISESVCLTRAETLTATQWTVGGAGISWQWLHIMMSLQLTSAVRCKA